VADVDALLNPDDATCDVMVGGWDTDTPDLPTTVTTDIEETTNLAIDPIPVGTVDPSDWPSRGLAVDKDPYTGWQPTGSRDDVALVSEIHPDPYVPEAWPGDGSELTQAQLQSAPPATVISAHGGWYTPNGLIRVPAGDEITTYVPIGTAMDNVLGEHVDSGHIFPRDREFQHTYTAGELMPNFTFLHFGGRAGEIQGAHVVGVTAPTNLASLVRANEGTIWVAACAAVYAPVGQTADQALANVPVYTPGSAAATGSAKVSVNGRKGALTVVSISPAKS
jgi:hypothetical protein